MEAADKNFNKKGRQQAVYLGFLVPPARFERATCGLEESSSRVQLRTFVISLADPRVTGVISLSQLLTICFVTPSFSASSSCVNPLDLRISLSISLYLLIDTTFQLQCTHILHKITIFVNNTFENSKYCYTKHNKITKFVIFEP